MKIQNISFPVCVCIKLARPVRVKLSPTGRLIQLYDQ